MKRLPWQLGCLTQLKTLEIDKNPLKTLPSKIKKGNISTLLSYFSQKRLIGQSNQIRISIIGAEGIGKTSLCCHLRRESIPQHNISTEAIQFSEFDEQKIQFNLFDFGGQEVFHPNHILFLSQNTIYLIAFNMTTRYQQSLKYWLKTLSFLVKDCPILLVGTHLDAKNDIQFSMNDAVLLADEIGVTNVISCFGISNTTGKGPLFSSFFPPSFPSLLLSSISFSSPPFPSLLLLLFSPSSLSPPSLSSFIHISFHLLFPVLSTPSLLPFSPSILLSISLSYSLLSFLVLPYSCILPSFAHSPSSASSFISPLSFHFPTPLILLFPFPFPFCSAFPISISACTFIRSGALFLLLPVF